MFMVPYGGVNPGGEGEGREEGGDAFSEFLTPEKAAISAEGRGRWGALTLHHFRPFLLSQGGDRVTRGRGRGSGMMVRGKGIE